MSEVRCPMCSKLNPADQDICQFCEARLKPLQVEPTPGDESFGMGDFPFSQTESDQTSEDQDWWQALRGVSGVEDEGESKQSRDDWVNQLREKPLQDELPGPASRDWSMETIGPSSVEPETSDWLSKIRGEAFLGDTGEGPEEDISDADEASLSDWSARGEAVEAPDWLLGIEKSPEGSPSAQGEDLHERIESASEEKTADMPFDRPEAELGEIVDEGTGVSEPSPEEQKTGLTGLLSFLRDKPQKSTPTSEEEQQEQDVPDWSMEEASEFETGEPEPLKSELHDLPDWLLDEKPDEKEEPPQGVESAALPGEGLPDWLLDIETADETTPDELVEPQALETRMAESAEPPEPPEGDLPDWLMAGEAEDEAVPEEISEPKIAELPVDLEEAELIEEPEPIEAAVQPEDEGLPAWLLEGESLSTDEVGEGEPSEAEELPDWLREAPQVAETLPDIPQGPSDQVPQTEEVEIQSEEFPEWLQEAEPETVMMQPEAGVPDWLSDEEEEQTDRLAEDEEILESPAIESPLGGTEEQVPDWLAGSDEEIPEWLKDEAAEATFAAEKEAETDDVPDWLKWDEFPVDSEAEAETDQVSDDVDELLISLSHQAAVGEVSILDQGDDELVEDDLSWLSDLEQSYPGLEFEEADTVKTSQRPAESYPQGEREEVEAGIAEDFPEWISSVAAEEEELRPVESEPAVEIPEPEEEAELIPGELPGWLEAMRPVDSIAVAMAAMDTETVAEGAGPLAGLKGVLKAEPDISYTSKPPAYSLKLQVSEEQKSNAEILRQLVGAELIEQAVPSVPVISSQYILRIAIFILLSISILIPIIFSVPQFAIPSAGNIANDVMVVSQLVDRVPAGSPVLLAVDYEPGLSGEMDLYTGMLVEHLMARDAYITLISTVPTGALQAERLFQDLNQSGNYQYSAPERYLNLGFIPGGAAGLLSFAVSPQNTVPISLDGNQAWQGTTLAAIKNLSDFSLMVVSSEDPDRARAWIEQVQPHLGSTPMVVVSSAQAEPVVRPYYDSLPQQVQGILSGPAASSVYSIVVPSITKKDAQVYWTPFNIAALLACGLILVLGGYYIILAYLKRNKGSSEGEV